ncbi:Serine/threonine protein kinase [Trema orientale]|uniref:Serine/threonine protein kinase n=1 Tax=Trema orientale TaxID=63057 RepID=A0A2P5EL95_TREOI|nr:Serine/threonine protein kinase [Trema orientale]
MSGGHNRNIPIHDDDDGDYDHPLIDRRSTSGDPPPRSSHAAGEQSYNIIVAAEAAVKQQHDQDQQTSSTTNPNISKEVLCDIKFDEHGERRISEKLVLLNKSIGTLVYEGKYEGREPPVAVKCLVLTQYAKVDIEEMFNKLEKSDVPRTNIARYYGLEWDRDFGYLVLERYICNLDDLVQICDPYVYEYLDISPGDDHEDQYSSTRARPVTVYQADRLEPLKNVLGDVRLSQENGRPSPLLFKLMRDIVSGLIDLHELGIIHGDLKPQNVLITKRIRGLCAKLCDMGISKRLLENMASSSCGTSDNQPHEHASPKTFDVDMFSLGWILFFSITGGKLPFVGDHYDRNGKDIVENKVDLFLVKDFPEAYHLISLLLSPRPELRPNAIQVLNHPLLWNSETRLSFIRDTSDIIKTYPDLLQALEATRARAIGTTWSTGKNKVDDKIINHMSRHRYYKFDHVSHLLRLMRNMLSHYEELSKDIKELVGPELEDLDAYFKIRFPELLIEVYKVVCSHPCKEEPCFRKYFRAGNV